MQTNSFRYFVMEWDSNCNSPLDYNKFKTNDITNYIDESYTKGDIIIVDLEKNIIINSSTYKWSEID